MAEKILNTRIQLKYDTLAAWQGSVFNGDDPTKYLKPGEVAVVTLGPNKEEAPEAKGNQHPLLFKVGNGVNKFDDLPWASALAADVYDWAKLSYDSFLTELEKTFYTETEINNLIANYSTTAQINTAISDAEGRAATDAKNKADQALEDAKAYTDVLRNDVSIPEGGFASKSEFDALKEKVEDEDGALARANEAYELADAARTEDEVNTQIDTKLNAYRTSAAQDAIDETKADKSVVEAMYTNTQIDGFVQNAAKAGTDAAAEVLGTASDAATANTVYGAKAAAAAAQSDATTAKTKIEAFLGTITPDGANEVIDTLAEVQAELDRLGDAVELEEQFAAKVDKTVYEEHLTAQDTRDDGQDAKILALEGKAGLDKVGTVTSITAGDGLDGGTITESGTISLNAATKASLELADSAVQPGDLGTMASEAADDYVKKADATGFNDILTKTEASTTYQPKGEYATAEQGGKADSALQTVTAGEGIQVSTKADNSQTISIDDTLVWVFDCGNASDKINPIA